MKTLFLSYDTFNDTFDLLDEKGCVFYGTLTQVKQWLKDNNYKEKDELTYEQDNLLV